MAYLLRSTTVAGLSNAISPTSRSLNHFPKKNSFFWLDLYVEQRVASGQYVPGLGTVRHGKIR